MTNPTDDQLLQVKQLTRDYGAFRAVDHISFSLQRGEVLGLLGPNGAGKSTTMQMLCGALAPTAGSIQVANVDLLANPIAAKRAIGFLPEIPPLYPELTVDEYLLYCAKLRAVAKPRQTDAIELAKQRCGLQHVSKRLIANLSKGYQQRIGIAQAIVHAPQVVILDEPTIGLDPIQIREIRNLIRELGNDHGVILSTHILPEVQMTCDRVQIINQGRLVFNDSVKQINQQANTLLIQLNQAPNTAALAAIAGVSRVEAINNNRFRIHFDSEPSPAAAIAQASVENNWGIVELTPEINSLEHIFVELTSQEINIPDKVAI